MSETFPVMGKRELHAQMHTGLNDFLAFLDGFSPAQMTEPTDAAGWTVCDHLTHCAVWAEGIAALLRREDRWAAMGLARHSDEDQYHEDVDVINEQIAQQHRDKTAAEARTWLIAAHAQVAAAVEALEEAELNAPYDAFIPPFTGQKGAPIYLYILGNTAHHYEEHTPWIHAIVQGDSE